MASKEKVLTETVIFNVSPQMKRLAKMGATQSGKPFSEFMREILEDGLKRRKVKLPEVES